MRDQNSQQDIPLLLVLDVSRDELSVADLTRFVRACFGNTTSAEVINALNKSALTPVPHPDPLGLDQALPPFDKAHHFGFKSGNARGILELLVTRCRFLQVGYQLLFQGEFSSDLREACKTAMQVASEFYGQGENLPYSGAEIWLFADDATLCYVS
ncbi:MAG: hypothetical protein WBE06_06545, partial [Phycisphaerae bacterium]